MPPLAGLHHEYSLYAGIMAPLAYFVVATSWQASVGPSSSEAMFVAAVLEQNENPLSVQPGQSKVLLYEGTRRFAGFSSDKKVL